MDLDPPIATPRPPADAGSWHSHPDEYAWVRDSEDAEVVAYLQAERDYYDVRSRSLSAVVTEIDAELRSHTAPVESSAPWDEGGYRYWRETPDGGELPRLMRSTGESTQCLLDLATVAADAGSTYCDLGSCEVSPNGRLLAWAADTSGAEVFTLRIRDLESGTDLPVGVDRTHYGAAWSADSRYVFFTTPDHAWRPSQVHRLDTATGDTAMVVDEPDERFFLEVQTSRSGRWVMVTSASRTTSSVFVIPADDPLVPPRLLAPREEGVEYLAEHDRGSDRWLIVTNRRSTEFGIVAAPIGTTSAGDWEPWLDPHPGERIHHALAFAVGGDCVVVDGRRNGAALVRVLEPDGRLRFEIGPDEPAGTVRLGISAEDDQPYVTVVTESFTTPPVWWDVDLRSGARTQRHAKQVPGFDPRAYVGEVVHAPGDDGWSIPIVVVRRHETPLDGTAPCLLYAYGSYEAVDDPAFELPIIPLLDRGMVFAKAHIRGGGEVGRDQWLDGRMDRKWNTFRDYAAAAYALGHGTPEWSALVDADRIVGRGGSAGGLLQGVSYWSHPELWAGIVAEVPFVDVVNSMADKDLPLTVNEWQEWGSPFIDDQREYLYSYAPYENIPPADSRPPLLVTGAVHDPRVLVHEPAKWVARLRASDPRRGAGAEGVAPVEPGIVLFRVETAEGSHGGPAGRFAALRYEAEIDAWILAAVGQAGASTGDASAGGAST